MFACGRQSETCRVPQLHGRKAKKETLILAALRYALVRIRVRVLSAGRKKKQETGQSCSFIGQRPSANRIHVSCLNLGQQGNKRAGSYSLELILLWHVPSVLKFPITDPRNTVRGLRSFEQPCRRQPFHCCSSRFRSRCSSSTWSALRKLAGGTDQTFAPLSQTHRVSEQSHSPRCWEFECAQVFSRRQYAESMAVTEVQQAGRKLRTCRNVVALLKPVCRWRAFLCGDLCGDCCGY